MKYVYALLALLALAAALEWHGHHRGYGDGVAATQAAADKKVDKARGIARQAQAERIAAEQSLASVQSLLKAQREQLENARFFADAAIADRDRVQRQYDDLVARRKAAVKETAHAHPECSDLEHLPVCPAVAERLWGIPAGHPSAPGH